MISLNPYTYLAGAVGVAAIAGSFYVQSTLIHKYHMAYDCAESGLSCPKGAENIPHLRALVTQMTTAQDNQTGKTQANIIKVVQGPKEIQSIIREIQLAPVSKPCTAPVDSEEVKNAF